METLEVYLKIQAYAKKQVSKSITVVEEIKTDTIASVKQRLNKK